jgi:hypothetical protein
MSTSKPHIRQLLQEIKAIANKTLENEAKIVYLNDEIKSRLSQEQLQAGDGCVLPDPGMFHKTENDKKVGVIVKEKWNNRLFSSLDNKATVVVYWRTFVWYGTFRHVKKTLETFFVDYEQKDAQAPLDCCICLESNDTLRLEYVFECTHQFCIQCVPKIAHSVCPLCRSRSLTIK